MEEPTWGDVLVSYLVVPLIPLLLWALSNPLAGIGLLVGIAGVVLGGRLAYRLFRCFRDCQGFTLVLGETARITIAPPSDDATCTPNGHTPS